jgi:hypothetical protein
MLTGPPPKFHETRDIHYAQASKSAVIWEIVGRSL